MRIEWWNVRKWILRRPILRAIPTLCNCYVYVATASCICMFFASSLSSCHILKGFLCFRLESACTYASSFTVSVVAISITQRGSCTFILSYIVCNYIVEDFKLSVSNQKYLQNCYQISFRLELFYFVSILDFSIVEKLKKKKKFVYS